MQAKRTTGALRGALWLGTALLGGLGLVASTGVIGSSPSTIEASPAQAEHGHDHEHADDRHVSSLGPDGRFTGPGEVWPPRVRGASDVVALDFAGEEAPTSERAIEAAAAAPILAAAGGPALDAVRDEPRVTAALGDRSVLISVTGDEVVPGSAKGDPPATLALFYSHDRRATVEVYLDGFRLIEVISRPADRDQPPLGVDEKHRAGQLATAHWEAAGDERIGELEPFVILAVRPDGRYNGTRVAYVSFHADNEARPELLTWIDLTTESVLEAEVDR